MSRTLLHIVFDVTPIVVFVANLAVIVLGHRVGVRRFARLGALANEGTAAIEAAVFGLLGLLVGFSFSGAQSRLDIRRSQIVNEANTIGTAYLRLELLPEATRPAMKDLFRRYTEERIAYFQRARDPAGIQRESERIGELQRDMWTRVVAATAKAVDNRAALLVLPSINEMFDVVTEREAYQRIHIPVAALVLLAFLSVLCGLFAGIGMAKNVRPSHLYVVTFAGTMALIAYVVLNLEFPRIGFVRFEALDALLQQVRDGMI